MADIFISYSQLDRPLAHELAEFLENRGYDVWWDYDLVGGVKFRDKIMIELRAAKASIVIWSPNSVGRDFVIDEADEAKTARKLLPVRVEELDYGSIPLGFRQMQTDLVTRPDLILRALEERGIVPSSPPKKLAQVGPVVIGGGTVAPEALALSDEIASWGYVKQSADPAELRAFLARYAQSDFAELARVRLGAMEEKAWSVAARANSAEALVAFVLAYPDGRRTGEAQRALYSHERRARTTLDMNDPEALSRFLRTFPNGFAADEVRARINDLKRAQAETEAWNALQDQPGRARLEAYLKEFPLGRHAKDAHAMLAPVEAAERRAARWSKIKEQPFSEQLRSFIAEFEEGPEVEAARSLLAARMREKEAAVWAKLKDERLPVPLLSFLAQFPDTGRRDEVGAKLAEWHTAMENEAWGVVESAGERHVFQAFLTAFPSGRLASEARKRAQTGGGWLGFASRKPKASRHKASGVAAQQPQPVAPEASDVPPFLTKGSRKEVANNLQPTGTDTPGTAQLGGSKPAPSAGGRFLAFVVVLMFGLSVDMGSMALVDPYSLHGATFYDPIMGYHANPAMMIAALSFCAGFLIVYWAKAVRIEQHVGSSWQSRSIHATGLLLLLAACTALALVSDLYGYTCGSGTCSGPSSYAIFHGAVTMIFALVWYASHRFFRRPEWPVALLGIAAVAPPAFLIPNFIDLLTPSNHAFTQALWAWGGLAVAVCAFVPFLIDRWVRSRVSKVAR